VWAFFMFYPPTVFDGAPLTQGLPRSVRKISHYATVYHYILYARASKTVKDSGKTAQSSVCVSSA
ncbi:MAG: hypothetical protein IJU84_00950, partial [Clostridia bacterium]|nr:hypothetical protein [Clostridia bacterium]